MLSFLDREYAEGKVLLLSLDVCDRPRNVPLPQAGVVRMNNYGRGAGRTLQRNGRMTITAHGKGAPKYVQDDLQNNGDRCEHERRQDDVSAAVDRECMTLYGEDYILEVYFEEMDIHSPHFSIECCRYSPLSIIL